MMNKNSNSYNKSESIQWNDNTPAKCSQHIGISADKTVVTNATKTNGTLYTDI